MSTKIVISPYAARLPNGRYSPKSYPYWPKLISLLNADGYEVIQIGVTGEQRVEGVGQFITNFPFHKLRDLVNDCQTWLSVDNFFPHFCHCERLKSGIVLWGQSDPRIFGYPQNVNLLRDEKFLRAFQYQSWMNAEYNDDAFVVPSMVLTAVRKVTGKWGNREESLELNSLKKRSAVSLPL